jgi:hypothetical protein
VEIERGRMNCYSSPDILRVFKLRNMRWAGHVACMADGKMHAECWSDNLKGRDHLGELGVDVNIILKWILKKHSVKVWTEFI